MGAMSPKSRNVIQLFLFRDPGAVRAAPGPHFPGGWGGLPGSPAAVQKGQDHLSGLGQGLPRKAVHRQIGIALVEGARWASTSARVCPGSMAIPLVARFWMRLVSSSIGTRR